MEFKQKGIERVSDILGERGKLSIERLKKISPDFAAYIVNFGYADLYTRNGLTDKERELAAVASLISQRNNGLPLKSHLQGMLNVGWEKSQIIELIIFLSAYVGFPSTVDALLVAQELFDSLEK